MSHDWIVRLPTWLGDTVMALPTLRALDRSLEGRLVLWGQAKYRELLAVAGLDRPFIAYRRRRGPLGAADVASAVAAIRRRSPAAALLLPNAFEPALIVALAGVPRRLGYATDGRRHLLTDAVERPPISRLAHESERFATLLAAAGLGPPRPEDAEIAAGDQLRRRGAELLDAGPVFLGLVPGAANDAAKRWPTASFAALAAESATRWRARPLLLGSHADRPVIDAVREACAVDCLAIADTGLLDLAATLLRCRAVVSNDTGAAHLAAALGVPTLVVFGPTAPQRTAPRGRRARWVKAGVFCQPCEASVCPLDHRCMTEMRPDRVLELLAGLWEERHASS